MGNFFECFRTALNSNSTTTTQAIVFWQFQYRIDLPQVKLDLIPSIVDFAYSLQYKLKLRKY